MIGTPSSARRGSLRRAVAALLVPFAILGLQACSSNNGSTPDSATTGSFVDAPVTGLGYETRAWTPRGPNQIWVALATSSDGQQLVAATRSGLLMTSADGGNTWTTRKTGLAVSAVASSADGQTLLVADSKTLYLSTDGGSSWTTRSGKWTGAAISADGQTLVTVKADQMQVWISHNAGTSWNVIPGAEYWGPVTVSPDGVQVIISQPGVALYTSVDGGSIFARHGTMNRDVSGVATSDDGTIRYAATATGELYRSTNFSTTWTRIGAAGFANRVAISGDGRRVLASMGKTLHFSNDGAATWNTKSGRNWQTLAITDDGTTAFAAGGSTAPRTLEPVQVYTDTTALTGANGSYQCYAGETVAFLLGNLRLGQTPCNGVAHVYQMVGLGDSEAKGTRIAQLLQSLNTSGDPANIVLPDLTGIDVNVILNGSDGDFSASAAAFLADVSAAAGTTFSLVDAATAQANVVAELAKLTDAHRDALCSLDTCNSGLLDLLNSAVTQRLGGTVSGMPDGKKVTLRFTASSGDKDTVVIGTTGAWKFVSSVAEGATYTVTAQSDADLNCGVTNGSGTMPLGNVTDVDVSCVAIAPLSAAVRVTVAGLAPGQYVRPSLSLGGDIFQLPAITHDLLFAEANGTYEFNLQVPPGLDYSVTLGAVSEPGMNCTVSNGSGQNVASLTDALIDNVRITCGAQPYTISGTVSGLPPGETLELRNDDSAGSFSTVTVDTNGSYAFPANFFGNYSLSFTHAPAGMQCLFGSASGAPVVPSKTVDVTCAGGRLSGAANLPSGSTLYLNINTSAGNSQLLLTGTGASAPFSTGYYPPGTTYTVSTGSFTSPIATCNPVTNGSGTMGTTDVTNLAVSCAGRIMPGMFP